MSARGTGRGRAVRAPTGLGSRAGTGAWALTLAGVLAVTQPVHAEPCGTAGLTEDGACVDAVTLAFCDEVRDEAVFVPCPDGEICAERADRPGFYLCIDAAQTPCADIPLNGKCTTDDATLFCHEGKAVLTPCPDGTICALSPETMAPECVSQVLYEDAGSSMPRGGNDADASVDEEDANASTTPEATPDAGVEVGPDAARGGTAGPGALPAVDGGPGYHARGGGSTGCSGGGPGQAPPLGWLVVLLGVGLAWGRRGR